MWEHAWYAHNPKADSLSDDKKGKSVEYRIRIAITPISFIRAQDKITQINKVLLCFI